MIYDAKHRKLSSFVVGPPADSSSSSSEGGGGGFEREPRGGRKFGKGREVREGKAFENALY